MKLTILERASIALTALAFTAMAGFFLGSSSGAGGERVTTQLNAAPSPAQSPAEQSPARSQLPDQLQQEPSVAFPLNLNTATVEELQTLPGIGEVKAQAIVDYRAEHGPFRYVEDLRGVSGIGDGILAKIMDYVTVGN